MTPQPRDLAHALAGQESSLALDEPLAPCTPRLYKAKLKASSLGKLSTSSQGRSNSFLLTVLKALTTVLVLVNIPKKDCRPQHLQNLRVTHRDWH